MSTRLRLSGPNYLLETGVDALEYLQRLPDEVWGRVDTVVFDPPYFDPKDVERVNHRSKLQDGRIGFREQHTRIMSPKHRTDILSYIRSHIPSTARIMHFHTVRSRIQISNVCCEHVWVKPINIAIAGSNERNNGEHIVIEGEPIKGRIPGRILSRYLPFDAPMCHAPSRTGVYTWTIARGCAKPYDLYREFFRHLDSQCVVDPFAGYGMSIKAALHRRAEIYACDMDTKLDWRHMVQDPLAYFNGEVDP